MSLPGLTLPEQSAWDPLIEGEGSIDPMGLAPLSDRLADHLVPGVRARMRRVRFVTAMAVGAVACETLGDESPSDGISTPAICFEWLVLEAMVRRLGGQLPDGVPGSAKARAVVAKSQRLSAATYLKGPTVFGFNGVYKSFAVDCSVVTSDLQPGARSIDLVRRWENDQGFDGFVDAVSGTVGGRLRVQIRDQVRDALRTGRCSTNPTSWLFGHLATSLRPDTADVEERRSLRLLIVDSEHTTRAELARLLVRHDGERSEAELLDLVRPHCTTQLGEIIDAVVAYERLVALIDAAFYTLCSLSHSLGTQPLTPHMAVDHEILIQCAKECPNRFREAADRMALIGADDGLEDRLGEFAIKRSPVDLAQLVLDHHERVQSMKPPAGKRPWFEPFRNGHVVRPGYGTPNAPELGPRFVHPVRVTPLRRFMVDTAT